MMLGEYWYTCLTEASSEAEMMVAYLIQPDVQKFYIPAQVRNRIWVRVEGLSTWRQASGFGF